MYCRAPDPAMLYEVQSTRRISGLYGAGQRFKLLGNPSLSNRPSTRDCRPSTLHPSPGNFTCVGSVNVGNASYVWLPLYPNASAPSG